LIEFFTTFPESLQDKRQSENIDKFISMLNGIFKYSSFRYESLNQVVLLLNFFKEKGVTFLDKTKRKICSMVPEHPEYAFKFLEQNFPELAYEYTIRFESTTLMELNKLCSKLSRVLERIKDAPYSSLSDLDWEIKRNSSIELLKRDTPRNPITFYWEHRVKNKINELLFQEPGLNTVTPCFPIIHDYMKIDFSHHRKTIEKIDTLAEQLKTNEKFIEGRAEENTRPSFGDY